MPRLLQSRILLISLRILIASDVHLGYGEKLPIRNNDSFNSFDELLGIGKQHDVDMCILGEVKVGSPPCF